MSIIEVCGNIKIDQNPNLERTYKTNNRVKAHDVVSNFSKWELQEYKKCKNDPKYFARNYVKVINLDDGLVPFDLYPYQEQMFDNCNNNRFTITLAPRQSGKSIAFVVYLLWYAIFQPDKNVAILANKEKTSKQLLRRISLALENLPFFLQPGCRALNKTDIEFDNNSKIFAAATSSDSIRGESVNLLYLDEFAFVDNDEEFYTSTYPVITSGTKSKVIITSTANGIGNRFYKIWKNARDGKNSYVPFIVKWQDVPGRDEKWKREQIANTSARQFAQEFGCSFLGSGKTLIDGEVIADIKGIDPIHVKGNLKIYEETQKDHRYVLIADVSEGGGNDYSAFSVIDVSVSPFKQVAVYKNNKISPYIYPDVIEETAKSYNNAYVCIESNDQGSLVNHIMVYEKDYENIYLESRVDKEKMGLKTTRKSKRIGCSTIKGLIEENEILILDQETVEEIGTFEERNGSYQASRGSNDDLIMTLVLFGYLSSTERFQNEFEFDIKNKIYSEEKINNLRENERPPFGAIISSNIDEDEIPTPFISDEDGIKFKRDDIFGVVIEGTDFEDDDKFMF